VTSLGVARALQNVQNNKQPSSQNNSASRGEFRMGRIQRQKV